MEAKTGLSKDVFLANWIIQDLNLYLNEPFSKLLWKWSLKREWHDKFSIYKTCSVIHLADLTAIINFKKGRLDVHKFK